MDKVDFDFLISVKLSHQCGEFKVPTTITGHEAYIEGKGVLEMSLVNGTFHGICSNCGEGYSVGCADLLEEINKAYEYTSEKWEKWPQMVNLLRLIVVEGVLDEETIKRGEKLLKGLSLNPNV